MTEREREPLTGRLLLLFDGSPGSQAALMHGLLLAQAQQRQLLAVYLHEQDLSSSCALASSVEIGAVSGQPRALDSASYRLSQAVRVQRVRACLEHLAGEGHAVSQFIEHAGSPAEVLARLIEPGDWILIGRSGYAAYQQGRPGRLARRLVERMSAPVMLSSPTGTMAPGAVGLVLEPGSQSVWLLERALDHARSSNRALVVLADPSLPLDQAPLTGVRYVSARLSGPLSLLKHCQDQDVGELVLDRQGALLGRLLNEDWLASLDYPLLVVSESPQQA